MTERLRFKVEGMDCASCARTVETGVRRIAGVSAITISTTTETLSLSAASTGTAEAVEKVVRDLGYKPTLLKQDAAPPAPPPQSETNAHGLNRDAARVDEARP